MRDQIKARKALYRNGSVVGTLVAFVIIIVFLAYFRDVYRLMADPILVNDLDLIVTAPDGTVYRGNAFTGASRTLGIC